MAPDLMETNDRVKELLPRTGYVKLIGGGIMQHRPFFTRLFLIVFLSTSLTAFAPDRSKSADSTVSAIHQFIERGFSAYPASTRAEILQYYGRPHRTEVKMVRNNHYPTIVDRIHTLFYDGLTIKIYEATLPEQEFVIAVLLNGNQYRPIGGLNVGATAAHIIETLGVPTVVTAELMIYDEMQSGEGRVCFRMDGEVVKDIFWEYYFD